jgi:hypothetical protein
MSPGVVEECAESPVAVVNVTLEGPPAADGADAIDFDGTGEVAPAGTLVGTTVATMSAEMKDVRATVVESFDTTDVPFVSRRPFLTIFPAIEGAKGRAVRIDSVVA